MYSNPILISKQVSRRILMLSMDWCFVCLMANAGFCCHFLCFGTSFGECSVDFCAILQGLEVFCGVLWSYAVFYAILYPLHHCQWVLSACSCWRSPSNLAQPARWHQLIKYLWLLSLRCITFCWLLDCCLRGIAQVLQEWSDCSNFSPNFILTVIFFFLSCYPFSPSAVFFKFLSCLHPSFVSFLIPILPTRVFFGLGLRVRWFRGFRCFLR